jgi:nucleotide-binding universal stress UspA family protein
MKRFKNILLVAGGEGWKKSALKRALALAKSNHARLTVVDVMEELPRELRLLIPAMDIEDLQKLAVTERMKYLRRYIEPIANKGIRVAAKVLLGAPFIEIIREVVRNKHDLVIKTASVKGKFSDRLFGNTALRLMRKCPCPVWVIKPKHGGKYSRIMAAVDPAPYDRKRNALNAKIMELAASLADREGSELHVVHAWKFFGEKILSGPGRMSQSEVNKLARKVRAEHEERLTALVKKYAPEIPRDRIYLVKGDPERLLPALVKLKKIELLVMGTVCRTGIAGFVIGGTAEGVLPQVDCSVLTIKPAGFVTPVSCREGR